MTSLHDSLTPLLTFPVRIYAVTTQWWVLHMTPYNKNTHNKTCLAYSQDIQCVVTQKTCVKS